MKFAAEAGENLVLMKAPITERKEDLEAEAAKHSGALRTLFQTWSLSGRSQVDWDRADWCGSRKRRETQNNRCVNASMPR